MNHLARSFLLSACCALGGNAFGAHLSNQGFESGLTDWSSLGDVTAPSSATVTTYAPFPTGTPRPVSPIQGSSMARLVSNNGVDLDSNVAALDAFFGLAGLDSLASKYSAYNGSGIKQEFSGSAGDVLKQRWNFFSTEEPDDPVTQDREGVDDTAFAVITGPGIINPLVFLANSLGVGNSGTSGWRTFSYNLPADGVYTIGFGVVNRSDEYFDAELFLDDFSDVPEPGSLALLGLGLACLGGLRRNRSERL